jgi:type I restriction enzyme, R subunit
VRRCDVTGRTTAPEAWNCGNISTEVSYNTWGSSLQCEDGLILLNEADTRRRFVTPALQRAGWDTEPHAILEERTFTDGRIVPMGMNQARRREPKRADYILRYTRDFPIAVVEAKPESDPEAAGLQQAKEYAEFLSLKYAYSTNGHGIVEFDYILGQERRIAAYPTPDELWARLQASTGLDPTSERRLLAPCNHLTGKIPRYYQEIAINRTVEQILLGKKRNLLTLATGTGKTIVAFQICWKLWTSRWNRDGDQTRKPRILYLADRDILIDQPKDNIFAPFGDARHKIQYGETSKSREMYFAIYQAIAEDERRPGLYKEYPPDFFDLIIVDECHRGSARDESKWREILEYFGPAYQLGMTATPLRAENRDTYRYFGNPIYQYSLLQGIEDGFLAPYRVHRVVTQVDATGWRPSRGELDRYGRQIPDGDYETKDFEKIVALQARTEAIAHHLTAFMRKTDPLAKTIVFCVNQEHALEMRRALVNLNRDLVAKYPDYVCRVTAEEGDIGRGHFGRFQDVERTSPVILTTSQLLTTGVDVPTCKNVVLARLVGSMVEFKQIIGRGTRVNADYNKLFFNVLDYTGSATKHFADPQFDGEPAFVEESEIDTSGEVVSTAVLESDVAPESAPVPLPLDVTSDSELPRKFYVDGGHIEIVAHMVHELDPDGRQLRVIQLADYAGEKVRTLFPLAADIKKAWANPQGRHEVIEALAERGIDFDELLAATGNPDLDPFDLICNLAYNAPLRTRRERVESLRLDKHRFLERFRTEARAVLESLLEKYAEYGSAQFVLPDVLKVPPLSERGTPVEIAEMFGGPQQLRDAISELQTILYA